MAMNHGSIHRGYEKIWSFWDKVYQDGENKQDGLSHKYGSTEESGERHGLMRLYKGEGTC